LKASAQASWWGLQILQRAAHGGVDECGGIGAYIGPEVDVDDQCARALKCRDQVLEQKGGFAGTA